MNTLIHPIHKKVDRYGRVLAFCLLLILTTIHQVQAAPSLPTSFYGTAQLSGAPAPDGTAITVSINGVQIAETTVRTVDGQSVYTLDVLGDDPDTPTVEGGVEGDTIVFYVNGYVAEQTASWQLGEYTLLDLTATVSSAPPVADNQSVVTDEDGPLAITLTGSDVNNDPLTFQIVDQPANGLLAGVPPNVIYTPNPDFNGVDSFTFIANDGTADSNVATVTITVNPLNDAPRIEPIGDQSVDEGAVHIVPVVAIDPEGDAITLSATGLPAFAAFVDNGDGTGILTLTPTHDDAGIYPNVLIQAQDGLAESNESLTITVNDRAAAPTVSFNTDFERNVAMHESGARVVDYSSSNLAFVNRPDTIIDVGIFSHWRSASGQATDQFLTVELVESGSHIIDRVMMRGAANTISLRDFDIRVSNTGFAPSDFVTVVSGTMPQDAELHEFIFAPTEARYVQIVIHNNWGHATIVSLHQFQVWTRAQQGGIVSLLEGPPATIVGASSTLNNSPSFAPERAIDDFSNTDWVSARGSDEWIMVDLGGDLFTIDRVRLMAGNFTQAPDAFEIRASTTTSDQNAFTTVFSGNGAATTAIQEFAFAPVEARYVQLYVYGVHGADQVNLSTLEVLTAHGQNAAKASGVGAFVVDASSELGSSTVGSRVIDFSQTTTWATASGQNTNQWVKIGLLGGQTYRIDRVQLRGHNLVNAPRDFEIRVSTTGTDDADFATVFSGTLPSDDLLHWFTFPPVEAKFVQIFILNTHGGANVQMNTFRVFSPDLGGMVVPFRDRSTDDAGSITDWLWDLGDGNSSTEQHPIHTYEIAGTYAVKLTVTNTNGVTDTAQMDYFAQPAPVADFTMNPDPPHEGVGNDFTDASTTPDGQLMGWAWTFTEEEKRTEQNPTNVFFPDNGEYPVELQVTDSRFLVQTIVRPINVINLPPTMLGAVGPTPVPWGIGWLFSPKPNDVLADIPTLRCDWDYDDNTTLAIENCATLENFATEKAYDQPGDYNPTITVTDKDGGTVSVSKVVNVTKHKSYLNILARSLDEDAEQVELEVRLWDADGPWKNPTWAPLANKSVEISTDVQNTTVTTDENGVAIASMTYGSNPFTITANFVEDALYQATNDTLVINTEQTLPKGDIIFVIDESTSMGDEQDDVKERVNEMAAQLAGRIDYQLGLVGFGAGILGNGGNSPHTHGLTYHDGNGRIHQPLTHDAAEFQNAIDELNVVGGREPGFQATAFAMQDIHGFRPTAAVCVVLITDEDATENIWEGGSETREDAIAALSTRNATFFAVADLDYLDVPRDYGIIPGSLTQATGGQPFEIEDFREDASAVLSAIIDQCSLRVEEQVLPDLAVSIDDGSEAVAAGEHITYTITVSNNIGMASNIVLTDRLPAEVIFLSASHGGSVNAGRVTWPDFTLTNGGSTSRTVTVQVNESLPTGVDTLTNTVEAFDQTYDVPELNEANNVATLATQVILNQAPVAVADTFSVNEDSESNLLDVLNNDSDPDGDTLTIDAVSAAINGTVAIADSTLHYTPTANVNGIETITYTISDGSISATAAITITIQSVNDAPLAVGDVASLVQDTSVTIDLLTNDSDIEGDSLSVTSISQPGNGTNARNADETVTYTPTVGFVGEDSFTYTVEDGNGGGATATVTVTVLPFHLDVCPLYPIGLPTVRLDGVQPGDQVDEIISGSQHPDWYLYLSWNGDYGYHALIDSLTPPGTSHLYINPNSASDVVLSVGDWVQAWPYIANDSNVEAALDAAIAEPYLIMPVWDEITGADFGIQYHVSRFARVRLLEYALPDRDRIWIEYIGDVTCGAGDLLNSIEAVNDTFTVGEDSVGNLLDVLTNDSDSTGSTLTIDAVGNASNGTVSIVANTLVYTPNVDFAGTEDFIYTVSNASGESETANVAVVVTPANDAPIAADDRFSVVPDSVDNVLDVLANDNDVDGDALTIVLVNQPATGTTAISGTSILFTPAISSTETVTFSYTMEDGYGGSATADVTVEVESPQAENCQLYPIGLPITRMAGLNPGDLVDEIISGSQHNEWYLYLSWNGDYGYQALIDSLTPPGTSHLYSNPNDASDTVLSVGDWVQAWPYIANDGNVAAALDAAIDEPSLIMPIWDVITGSDFDIQYQIAGFARVRLLSYTFPDRDRIWIEYLGEVACDDAAVTSAQISVPRQAESKVLNTTEIGSEVGEAFTDRETEDGEPMNPIVANAGGVTLGVSQMQLQSIYLPLVTALREPEMDVHSATLSLKLYLPLSSR